MRTNIKILFIALLLIWTSCAKENNSPATEFTLASGTFHGFLFENMEIIYFPYSATTTPPDFNVFAQTNDQGNILGPYLAHIGSENRFILSKEFDDIESAQTYFDSYSTPETTPLQPFALNVKPNQIWLIKTHSESYGKILIISTDFNNIDNEPFAQITFKADNLN